MTTNTPEHKASGEPAESVADALTKTRQVAEEIKEAADELGVVHAVLDTQLSDPAASTEDIEAAVERTQELEKRLNDSAEVLDSANEILERHAKA